jgi:hypothetical protein
VSDTNTLDTNTLLLRETGVARLDDGSEAVNVGPIVTALGFLTEGRGEDRGTDEQGTPLPDLLSLAFDVVKSIILGGRHADYFRQVKLAFDEHAEAEGQMSLALAKQASTVRRPTELVAASPPSLDLQQTGLELRARLQKLEEAVSQVALELNALDVSPPRRKASRSKASRSKASRRQTAGKTRPKAKAQAKAKPSAKAGNAKKKTKRR